MREICIKKRPRTAGTMCDIRGYGPRGPGSRIFWGNHEHAIMPVTTTIKSTRGARAGQNIGPNGKTLPTMLAKHYVCIHTHVHVRMKIYICHDLLLFRAVVPHSLSLLPLSLFFFFVVFCYYLNFK